jgi:exodeoxyribonuclease VII small subunit
LISQAGWVSVRAMPAAKTATTPQVAEFEQSLDELEQLVVRMEKGELSLDDSLQSFERGIALYRNCQGALDQAKLRVSQLLDPSAPESALPFDPDTP